MENSTEAAQLLLARGAEIEARTINNLTPLHYVASKNTTESAQLLESGAEVEARTVENYTLLHFAAEENSTEAAPLLLERGAKIEAMDKSNNQKPLNLARTNTGNTKAIIRLLMERALNTS